MLPKTFSDVISVFPRMYSVSKFAGSVTVKAYPGELTVWIATFPSGSITMAIVVASQNSATLCVWIDVSF